MEPNKRVILYVTPSYCSHKLSRQIEQEEGKSLMEVEECNLESLIFFS